MKAVDGADEAENAMGDGGSRHHQMDMVLAGMGVLLEVYLGCVYLCVYYSAPKGL